MESVATRYLNLLGPHVRPQNPNSDFISTVAGHSVTDGSELGPSYWVQNLVSRVRFSTAVSNAVRSSQSNKIFLEIGPHSALAGPIRQILAAENTGDCEYISVLTRGKDSHEEFLRSLGQLWMNNYPLSLDQVAGEGSFLTGLPLYPWHYEEPLWHESRLSREYRFRGFPHHELLGSKILESTSASPGWRNLLRLEDVPWIADHKVEGNVVLPGVSYLYMAGEAIRQVTGEPDFTCQQVHIKAALLLTEDDETEIITQLNRVSLTDNVDSAWYDFIVSSYHGGSWIKHAFGRVRSGGSESAWKGTEHSGSALSRVCSSKSWYRKFRSLGLEYGPRFTALKNMTADPLQPTLSASLTLDLRPGEERYYSVHPGTLDGLLQGLYPAAAGGQTRRFNELALLTYVDEFYMRPPPKEEKELRCLVEITEQRPNGSLGDAAAFSPINGGQTVVRSRGWQMSTINAPGVESGSQNPHGAAELEWREDIDFVEAASLIKPVGGKTEWYRLLDRFNVLCMAQSVDRLRNGPRPTREYLKHFHGWLQDMVSGFANGATMCSGVPDAADLVTINVEERSQMIEDLYDKLRGSPVDAPATAIHRISSYCGSIFSGNTSELELLLADGVLQHVYDCLLEDTDTSEFVSLVAHKRPNLRVLEIGAGTGGATNTVLQALKSARGEKMYSSYVYTDVSAGFFADAKERFKDYAGLEFAVLDISTDPLGQGFEAGSFDLIVAWNVLHATPSLHQSLTNVRKLLHPQGRLLLQEVDPQTKWINHAFGVISGWWAGVDDGRPSQPYVDLARWKDELSRAGFGDVSARYDGYVCNNMVCQPLARISPLKRVTLLHRAEQQTQGILAALDAAGHQVDSYILGDERSQLSPGQDVISALDISSPFFANLDEKSLVHFQRFVKAADNAACGIFWITGRCQVGCQTPAYAPILGLARVLRTELNLDLAVLELEDLVAAPEVVPRVFLEFQKRSSSDDPDVSPEYEWAHVGGKTLISRYHYTTATPEAVALPDDMNVRKLEQHRPGLTDTLYWKPVVARPLATDEVRIEVKAAGMNYKGMCLVLPFHIKWPSSRITPDVARRGRKS